MAKNGGSASNNGKGGVSTKATAAQNRRSRLTNARSKAPF